MIEIRGVVKLNKDPAEYQILISGVGGQGVLFITRLLAEAAIEMGLPVFTSETHGMAQRGGTVVSHLKVGDFTAPLIAPGQAGGLIALKPESVSQHGGYLKSGAWAAANSAFPIDGEGPFSLSCCDADGLARKLENPRAVNLIMLGFVLAGGRSADTGHAALFCGLDTIVTVLKRRLRSKDALLEASIRALEAGASAI